MSGPPLVGCQCGVRGPLQIAWLIGPHNWGFPKTMGPASLVSSGAWRNQTFFTDNCHEGQTELAPHVDRVVDAASAGASRSPRLRPPDLALGSLKHRR